MPRAENEPEMSIYGEQWDAARECAEEIEDPDFRAAYVAVLDAYEEGWAILRPVILASERMSKATREADWVDGLVDLDLVDPFRAVAFERRDAVPSGWAGLEEVIELGGPQRVLNILRMAATHPGFPPDVRDLLPPACEAFDAWMDRLPALLEPLIAVDESEPVLL